MEYERFFFFSHMGSQFDVGMYLFQVTRPVQSLGVQEELLLVSLVLEVVVLIALARVLLEMYPFNLDQDLNLNLLKLCKSDQCSKALRWWCNLRLTLWPVTVACCQYAGTYGWRATVSEQVRNSSRPTLRLVRAPWLCSRCVVEGACLPPPKPGAAGTAGSTQPRNATQSARLWLLLPFLLLWCPRVSSQFARVDKMYVI